MNKAILVGRMTKDPELRATSANMNVTTFSLAINRTFKNKEGNVEADFINIVVFGNQADNVAKYCSKGSQVGVEGRIQTRNYEAQDGTKRYVTEVIADRVEFLGSKSDRSNSSYNDIPTPEYDGPSNDDSGKEITIEKEDPFKDFGNEVSLSDDDLPF